MDRVKESRIMAFAGILGAVTYGVADLFLYMGCVMPSKDDVTTSWRVPEWRLMTSMSISVIGSFLMILGFISLARLYKETFRKIGNLLIIPSLLCLGSILYMHYTLGVYSPLTFMSAIKAGVPEQQAINLIQRANSYMNPLTAVLIILGYLTEAVLIVGILSGKIALKRRVLLYMYGGYALFLGLVVLICFLSGEWGFIGPVESIFETTFFIPPFLYWRKKTC